MAVEVSGIINSDTTWSGDIHLTGSVKVTNGATLTVSPGTTVTVKNGNNYKIWIDSTAFLVAETNDNDITFQSDSNGNSDWKGIEFTDNINSNSTNGSSLKGVTIKNAVYGTNVEGQGISIQYCTFEDNGKSIYLKEASKVNIGNSIFKDTGGGIDTPNEGGGAFSDIEIHNNNFLGGGTAAAIWPNQRNVDDITIRNNFVAESHSLGFQIGGGGYGSHIGDTEIKNNEIKSTSGISIDAYSWVNDSTPGLKINQNYISGSGTGIAFGHADNFSSNNIQINENNFKNNSTSLHYGNEQDFGSGPHFSLSGNIFESIENALDLKGLAITVQTNTFSGISEYVIKNANANTTFSGNNVTGFLGTSVFHTRETSNLGTAISLGENYFDAITKSADLADDGAENFEYKTIEISNYAESAYSISLPSGVPGEAIFAIEGTPKGGETLSIKEISGDRDGGPGLESYQWEVFDGTSWDVVSETSQYVVEASDEGKEIRAKISYRDGQDFRESVYARGFYQSFDFDNNNGFSTLGIKGLDPVSNSPDSDSLNIRFSPGSSTATWVYNDLFSRSSQTDFNNTKSLTGFTSGSSFNNLGKLFSENEIVVIQENPYTVLQIIDSKSRVHGDSINGLEARYIRFENDESGTGWNETQRIFYSDSGDAEFTITGTNEVGEQLSITESAADPDGTGTLSYIWQSSSDEITWGQIGTDTTYTLTSSEEGKKVRAIISYTDDEGFEESIITESRDIPITDNGDASFSISGSLKEVGEQLGITETTADPDGGTGTLSYVWQSSSDDSTWTQIGTDSTYTLTSAEEGKKVRAVISYTDGQSFSESIITSSEDIKTNEGEAVFEISGTTKVGQELSIIETTSDPDGGAGTLSYVWQSSSDDSTWAQIGTDSTYTLTSEEEGKKIRAIISYTDGQDYPASIITSSVEVQNNDDGDATFVINGTSLVGETLNISESTADPDGTGTLSYIWQSSSDEITWGQIGTDSTYTLTSLEEGKKVRAIISYTDDEGFEEEVIAEAIEIQERNYGLTTSINSPHEGYTLTTTVTTTNVATGTILYWSLGGSNIELSDFSSGRLSGSGTIDSSGSFSFEHSLAIDGQSEGSETIEINLFSDNSRTLQIGSAQQIISDAAIEIQIASIVEDINGLTRVVSQLIKGQNYSLTHVRDYDGNLHAGSKDSDTVSAYKYQHALDINGDGIKEALYTNKISGRWVTASIDPVTGKADFSDYGQGGSTRVVGIYDDPLIAVGNSNGGFLSDGVTPAPANFGVSDSERYVTVNGNQIDRLALNSQVRFQNDLNNDNLEAKVSGDYDSDGISEVYWKTTDGTAYLRALMHADGNIRYANYQNEQQMTDYLTANGHGSTVSDIV